MIEHEQQVELLDRYWTTLREDPTTSPPGALDPGLATMAEQLERHLRPPEPEAAFAGELQRRLDAEAATLTGRRDGRAPEAVRRWPTLRLMNAPRRWWPLAGLATAAVLLLAFVGIAFWISRPQPVSAQEILDKAQATAADIAAGGVQSFVLTEVTRSRPPLNAEAGYRGHEQIRVETTRWYEAPNRWRVENKGTVTSPDGQELAERAWHLLNISDGTDRWFYDVLHHTLQVQHLDPGMDGKGGLTRFGQDASDLDTVLKRASTCGTPALKGAETVADRSAFVIDLGPSKCPSASAPEMNGPSTIWVDKETFFVLKVVQYSSVDDQLLSTTEVTSVQYNVPIDPARFTFTPPADAKVQDSRPKPAPAADEFQQQLAQLARQVDFPLFVPRDVPTGLVPLQPRLDDIAGRQVELGYVPAKEANTTATAGPTGVRITQRKASYELIDRWPQQAQQAQPATIPGGQGWLRRGIRNADGTGSDSAAIVLRDGTLISVASFAVPADDLVKIAAALEPVPGSHPPLPNPKPLALAEIRQRVSFPVFVPTWVPTGLTPEPPVGGEQPTQNVEIRYHTADGAVGLTVGNGWLDCCPGFAKLRSEPVTLPNGIEGHLIRTPTDRYGGLTLWWQQDGTTVTLRGPAVGEADLVKIAASMSKTADLGQMEATPARPTPTPVPAPSFTILRPTWLPEPMTAHEQYVPNPNGPGSGVILTFDPRPGDKPHDLLTLRESPRGQDQATQVQDPQSTREQIGGREVIIVRRGEGCVTASWVQGEVALMLTNPYDPPGPPGAVRYSCDQLRQVVASIGETTVTLPSARPQATPSPAKPSPAASCDLSAFPEPYRRDLERRLATAVGGGQVEQGPFTFCLLLYADPSIKAPGEADHPSRASEIPGVGWAAAWVYRGPGLIGRISNSWGPLPDGADSRTGYDGLDDGQAGGRTGGGIVLPKGAKVGDRVQLGMKLDTPEGTFGARIAFTLPAHGVEDVAVLPWQGASDPVGKSGE